MKLKVIELFAGIGSQAMALRNLGIDYEVVGISEIDKFAIKSYETIHGKVYNFGNISKILELPYCDLLTYSSPCQDLSVMGRQEGIKKGTRSGLLLEVERLLLKAKEKGTLPKYLLLENVKNLVSKKFIKDFERWLDFLSSLGYYNNWKVLNAKDYGIPQNRERVFVVSSLENIDFEFPEKQPLNITMRELLESEVPEKYFLSEKAMKGFTDMTDRNGFVRGKIFNPREPEKCNIACTITTKAGERCTDNFVVKIKQLGNIRNGGSFGGNPQSGRIYSSDGLSPCLNTMGGGNLQPKVVIKEPINKEVRVRKLTPLECWRLMGFSDTDYFAAKSAGISDTQLYKQAGNSIVVTVLEGIFGNMFLRKHNKTV